MTSTWPFGSSVAVWFARAVLAGAEVYDFTTNQWSSGGSLTCFGHRVALQGKVLVDGRNPSIADQHRFRRDVAGIG
jgi:hypothetical protein